ncbi:hypothetical protein, partial [Bacteroides sp.]|uniref:hypothetical protein n=1 Tax=Bacteroides sp. TaxID=29523 RepID=UPI00258624E6
IRKLWVITKPGLEKVWALRIKKGCVSILTQPLFYLCNFIPTFAKDNLSVNKLSFIVNIQLE